MKLWIDDLRPPPDDYIWLTNSKGTIIFLENHVGITAISFDHDLGGDDTTRPILDYMIINEIFPPVVNVHSANVVGSTALLNTILRYFPDTTRVSYQGIPYRG